MKKTMNTKPVTLQLKKESLAILTNATLKEVIGGHLPLTIRNGDSHCAC